MLLTWWVHPFSLMLYTATHYICIQQMSLCHVSVWWSICVLPHDGLCLSIWIESTDAVTSCRSVGTHSCGEGAYKSSCDGRCCWLREYIHSGSYLILTLTTWVHPFWLISYTYTDDVSTSILAHALYSYTLHILTADESMSCICLMKYLCAPTWWAVFVYLNRKAPLHLAARLGHTAVVRELIEAHATVDAADYVSTSILAHILYLHWRREYIHSCSCFILLHSACTHQMDLCHMSDELSLCATWWAVFVYLYRLNRRRYITLLWRDTQL